MRNELYRRAREKQRQDLGRLGVDIPADEIEALDRWAVERGLPTRTAAVRAAIAIAVAGSAEAS